MTEDLLGRVRARAKDCCEYCQLPQAFYTFTFHVDHIIARQHGGQTTMGNLAYACPQCNLNKGPNIAGYDRISRRRVLVPLYNPRRHRWVKHFRWNGPQLIGLTAIGRATIQVLDMNAPEMLQIREALMDEGAFPPRDDD